MVMVDLTDLDMCNGLITRIPRDGFSLKEMLPVEFKFHRNFCKYFR